MTETLEINPNTDRQLYTDEELIGLLQRLAVELDRCPTVSDVRNLAEVLPDVATFERRFGSWKAALASTGLESPHGRSNASILATIAAFVDRHDRLPTKGEFNSDPELPSYTTVRVRLGGTAAVAELLLAGKTDNNL